jgi:hypothetical protein
MARIHLDGDFGTQRDAVDADFRYFGETIRVHPDASDLHHAELMLVATGIDLGDIDIDDPTTWTNEQAAALQKANDAVLQAIRGQIHPDDWDRFFKTAKTNRQSTFDLMAVSQKVAEAVAGFPTGQPSASSAGRPNTRRSSKGAGSSRRAAQSARRALRLIGDDRPDLQMAAVRAYEAKVAMQETG